jgi:hypothetical protein
MISIPNSIITSTGASVSNTVCSITAHTGTLMTNGKVQCDLSFFTGESSISNGYDKIIPVTVDGNGKITKRIGGLEISLTQEEATGANLPTTIYQKIVNSLNTSYGWSSFVS